MSFINRYEEQLLAAATSSRQAAVERRRRWRKPALGLGGLTAMGATAVAVLLLPGEGPLSPLQEARAALGSPGEIVHFRLAAYDPDPGGADPNHCRDFSPTEIWQATAGAPRLRLVYPPRTVDPKCGPVGRLADGTPVIGKYQTSFAGAVETDYVPVLKHAVHTVVGADDAPNLTLNLADPAHGFVSDGSGGQDTQATLRALLKAPGLHDEGISRRDGRLVRTFTLPEAKVEDDDPKRPRDGNVKYVVDAQTFAPISVVETYAQGRFARGSSKPEGYFEAKQGYVFASWERLPLDAAHEPLLRIQLPPGTTEATGTPKHFSQASRAVRLRREKEGDALLKTYLDRTGDPTGMTP